tara:strand:- start:2995 stop:3663 length:669 start_codon:yes stop_codon:yes gene_type:complete
MTIDQAIEEYEASIDYAVDQFINDTKELEEEGLSAEEILGIIAAIDFTSYFIEELRFATALNASMVATEDILANMRFFGSTTEQQLLALQNIQKFNIEGLTRQVTSTMQSSMAQGIVSKLNKKEIATLMRANIKTQIPRLDNVIGTQLSNFQRSVVLQMATDLPIDTLWEYIGPEDEKNRPVCKQFLSTDPLTESEIRNVKPDALETAGGVNCRHYFFPINV